MWDARNAVIVDVRDESVNVLAVPMHTWNKAGKTKRWEFEWANNEYIYPDKVRRRPYLDLRLHSSQDECVLIHTAP